MVCGRVCCSVQLCRRTATKLNIAFNNYGVLFFNKKKKKEKSFKKKYTHGSIAGPHSNVNVCSIVRGRRLRRALWGRARERWRTAGGGDDVGVTERERAGSLNSTSTRNINSNIVCTTIITSAEHPTILIYVRLLRLLGFFFFFYTHQKCTLFRCSNIVQC